MKLVLYGVPVSAFVAKVRTALDHKGLDYEERTPPDGYGSAAYRAIVPAGTVPGLTVDGEPLSESNAILEFLEEVRPEPPLFPGDALTRARLRALLGFHDQRLEGAVRVLFPFVKRNWRAEGAALSAAFDGVDAAFARLVPLDPGGPMAAGAPVSAVDLGYPCTVQMARMLGAEMGRAPAVPPAIADWIERCATIPDVARSLALHRAAMEAWLAGFRR